MAWLIIVIIGVIFAAPLLFVWAAYAFHWGWTGFPDKTLWPWLELLFVPLVLAIVGIWFNRQQTQREKESAERRERENALQAYLDNMTTLMIEHKLRAARAEQQDSEDWENVVAVARARTLTVLRILDSNRRGSVVRFLYEAKLITKGSPVVSLDEAILLNANLSGGLRSVTASKLYGTSGPNPRDAARTTLRNADLSGAYLVGANFMGTDLTGADLRGTFLLGATLTGAVLRDSILTGAIGITEKELERQSSSLEGAIMPDGQKYEGRLKSKERRKDGENSGSS